MCRAGAFLSLFLLCFAGAGAAADRLRDEDLRIYTEPPRIFLRPQRLKLLKRERERDSVRWRRFETLLAGKTPLPEPGFANALFFAVSGDGTAGSRAVQWALGPDADLRQTAIVFDWCRDLIGETESRLLADKLQTGIERTRSDSSVAAARSRLLAAVVLADDRPAVSSTELHGLVRWWEERIVPAAQAGRFTIGDGETAALFEILHVCRDNLNLDPRNDLPDFFKNLPLDRLASYYPGLFRGPDGEYRIPASHRRGAPDFRAAALGRAGELSMVAYDANSTESQILQGWLMHDRFMLKDALGIPYEFLWANPYQPGLSYYHLPLIYHDKGHGRLFARSDWDNSATWLGYFDGELQRFADGKLSAPGSLQGSAPIAIGGAMVLFANSSGRYKITAPQSEETADQKVFVLGLPPGRLFSVEIERGGKVERRADAGGILELELPRRTEVGFRLRETNGVHEERK